MDDIQEDDKEPEVIGVESLSAQNPVSQGQLMLMRLESYFKESKEYIDGKNFRP